MCLKRGWFIGKIHRRKKDFDLLAFDIPMAQELMVKEGFHPRVNLWAALIRRPVQLIQTGQVKQRLFFRVLSGS